MLSFTKSLLETVYVFLFKTDQFKVTINLSRHLDFIIYECPGVWASDEELAKLTAMLQEVARAGQGGKELPEYGCLTGDREDLKSRIISIAIDKKSGRAVGFSAQSYVDIVKGHFSERLVHLGLIYVDPSYQGKSVSYLLAMFPNIIITIKNGFRDTWVSNVTQVPAVYGLVAANYSDVYPGLESSKLQSFYHRYFSRQLFEDHKSVFGVGDDAFWDADMQIIKNSYTGGSDHLKKSFVECPKFRRESVNRICETYLDYTRGDDFVQIGRLSLSSFMDLLKNKKSKQSRIQVAVNMLILSVVASVLPLIKWFLPCFEQKTENKEVELGLVI
jgi:hypothetical protein